MAKVGDNANKLFNFRPIFFFAVALCFGILFAFLYKFYDVSLWWLLLLPPIVGASFYFCKTKRIIFRAVAAWCGLALFFFLGFVGFSLQVRDFEKTTVYNGECHVVGTVVEKKEYDFNACLVLDDVFISGKSVKGKLNAYLPLSFYQKVALCDEVLLLGDIQTDTEFFDVYGFRSYAIGENLRYSCDVDELAVTGTDFDLCLYLRARMQSRIESGMDKDPAEVTMAVLTGDTSGIDESLLDNMRRGGIAHIFAVSGLHVGALYAFCLLLLRKTKLKRIPKIGRFMMISTVLLFYGGICGFSASIIRAVVLCLVSYAAKLFLSSADFLETLGLSAIVILFLSPVSLLEVGFQLSFAACLGIAIFQKRIGQVCVEIGKAYRKRFPRKLTEAQEKILKNGDTLPPSLTERFLRFLVSVISVSFAAQLATAPIQLVHFGYLSVWSLLLNVVFVPIISAGFSFLLLFVSIACLLAASWSVFFLYIPNVVWSFLLLLFETADFSTLMITWRVSAQACICYYAGCIFLTDKLYLSAVFKRGCALACFFGFIFLLLAGNL